VPAKLFHDPLAVDVLLGRMMKHMQPDKTGEQILIHHWPITHRDGIGFRYRSSNLIFQA